MTHEQPPLRGTPAPPGDALALAAAAFGLARDGSTGGDAAPRTASLELDLDDPEQRRFGDHELLEKLGEGGMGVVYRARQLSLKREVALKLLAAGPWATRDFLERFRREAQNAARMQHPNIVPIHEIGVHDGLPFYTMRLVRGPTLAQFLAKHGPQSPRHAAMQMRTIAEAVHYAHTLGVLHLDLKPDNILLDERGWPQVTDFGLARRFDQRADVTIAGTPSYMAPESVRRELHPQAVTTDVYGLGATLYETLTGWPPFLGRLPHATLRQVIGRTPLPPRRLHRDIPRDLDAICMKCLAKAPTQRYASARELAEDLTRFLECRPVLARPLSLPARLGLLGRREPRLAAAVVMTLLVLLAGLVTSAVQWQRAQLNAVRAQGSALLARATLWRQRQGAVWRLYEDGNWFDAVPLLVANLVEQEAAGDRDAAALERRGLGALFAAMPRLIDRMPVGREVHAVAMTADGGLAAAGTSDGQVVLFDTATGGERWRVSAGSLRRAGVSDTVIRQLRFSDDGRYLLVTPEWRGWMPDPAGVGMAAIAVADGSVLVPPPTYAGFRDATFSADGRYAILRNGEGGRAQLWHVDPWKPIGPAAGHAGPDAAWLLAAGARHLAVARRSHLEFWDPVRLQPVHRYEYEAGRMPLAWAFSADGRLLVVADNAGEVRAVDAASGAVIRTLDPHPDGLAGSVGFSRDGRWLAVGRTDGDASIWQVDGWELQSASIRHRDQVQDVAVDVDSRLVLTVRGHDCCARRARLWQLPDARLRLPPVPVTPWMGLRGGSGRHGAAFAAAPGLLLLGGRDGYLTLWRVPPNPLRGARAPPRSAADLQFDGRHLVAVSGHEVRVVDAASEAPLSPPMTHPQPVSFAALTTDGTRLVTGSARELRIWDWRNARLVRPPIVLANTMLRLALSRDGRRFAATYGDYRDGTFHEVAQTWAIADGRPLAAAVPLRGPLLGWRFSPDGKRLIVWRQHGIDVLGADTLSPALTLQAPPALLGDSAFHDVVQGTDGRDLDALGVDGQGRAAALARWDARSGALRSQQVLATAAWRLAAAPEGGRLAFGGDLHELLRRDGTSVDVASTAVTPSAQAVAFSADGRLVAHALRDGVIVSDARDGVAVTPPLRAALADADCIVDLAFGPDGERLLARTRFGRWLLFALPDERRQREDLQNELALLRGAAVPAPLADRGLRAFLRSHDPGPPQSARVDLRPFAAADPDAVPMLPRDSAAPANLLDLSAAYNTSLTRQLRSPLEYNGVDLAELPLGIQRFLGVDYDIRGAVELATSGSGKARGTQAAQGLPSLALEGRYAALDLLVAAPAWSAPSPSEPVARVRLRYRDGGAALLDLRYGRDLRAATDSRADGPTPRIAWFGYSAVQTNGPMLPVQVFAARLPNPAPTRALERIELEAASTQWGAPLIIAITAEPSAAGHSRGERQPAARVRDASGPVRGAATMRAWCPTCRARSLR